MGLISINNFNKHIDNGLNTLSQFLWPTTNVIDCSSPTFFVFKLFPKNIKSNEIEKWAELQAHSLSPFNDGDKHMYLSQLGIHLWVSPRKFKGIPETAHQPKQSNGEFLIQGKEILYTQTWSDGVMTECITTDKTTIREGQQIIELQKLDTHRPWAIQRELDNKAKQPVFWKLLAVFVMFCSLFYLAAGYTTIYVQKNSAEKKSTQLTLELGGKLDKQIKLRNQEKTIVDLNNWQHEFSFFPETFSALAEKLSEQGSWKVTAIIWQNKTIELEFYSPTIDITSLITNLENLSVIKKVNIRPHNAQATWILEAQIK